MHIFNKKRSMSMIDLFKPNWTNTCIQLDYFGSYMSFEINYQGGGSTTKIEPNNNNNKKPK